MPAEVDEGEARGAYECAGASKASGQDGDVVVRSTYPARPLVHPAEARDRLVTH